MNEYTPPPWRWVRADAEDDDYMLLVGPDYDEESGEGTVIMGSPCAHAISVKKEQDAKIIEHGAELVEASLAALDALEGLAANVDTNPWVKQLRTALLKAGVLEPSA